MSIKNSRLCDGDGCFYLLTYMYFLAVRSGLAGLFVVHQRLSSLQLLS